MNTKLIIFIVIAFIYLIFVPYCKSVDESEWETFFFKVVPVRTVILLILYLIIF